LNQQLEAQETLLDLTIASFELLTPGNGQNIGEKKEKLANAIRERISRGGSGKSQAGTWPGEARQHNGRLPVMEGTVLLEDTSTVLRLK